MSAKLSDSQREFFDGKNFAHLATMCPDGHPSVSPVWVDLEGDLIRVNTAEGRLKTRNVRKDPRVGISVHDQEMPYKMVSVRGRVVEITHEGADEHIDSLAKKCLGQDSYPFRTTDEQRVILKIQPLLIAGQG